MSEPRRLRIAGIHHITLLVGDLARSASFYRNLLGMTLLADTVNDDDPDARHLIFGDRDGTPGTIVTCLEYPQLDAGQAGPGTAHHFALAVDSAEELAAWREYLIAQGAPCTEVMERGGLCSVYLRDPDGHIVELATAASPAPGPEAGGTSA